MKMNKSIKMTLRTSRDVEEDTTEDVVGDTSACLHRVNIDGMRIYEKKQLYRNLVFRKYLQL